MKGYICKLQKCEKGRRGVVSEREVTAKKIIVGPTESVTLSPTIKPATLLCCVAMASLGTPAHVSSNRPLQCSTWKAKRVRCAVSPPRWREGRRTVSFSLLLSHLLLIPHRTYFFHRFTHPLHILDWFHDIAIFELQVLMFKQVLSIIMLRGMN